MIGVHRILDIARGELGVKESPAGSNCVKYNAAYYGRSVSGSNYPWCCVFLWWCFQQAGMPQLFYGGGKTASCGTLADHAKRRGLFVRENYLPGDLVFLKFSGKAIQHIGIVEKIQLDGSLVTIEGNTGAGSDDNGGEVQRRIRPLRYAAGAYRPAYEEFEMTQAEFNAKMDQWLQARAMQEPGSFSEEARTWGERFGIIQGDAAGMLQYKSYCTREQMMVLLYRFLKTLERK